MITLPGPIPGNLEHCVDGASQDVSHRGVTCGLTAVGVPLEKKRPAHSEHSW